MLKRCGSAVIRSPTVQVRGENVVNLVNPGDCLKMSPVLNCLSVVMATNLALFIDSLRSAIFSCARFQRERESSLIVALFIRLFSPLHRILHPPFLFYSLKTHFLRLLNVHYTLSRGYQKSPDVRPSSVLLPALPWA